MLEILSKLMNEAKSEVLCRIFESIKPTNNLEDRDEAFNRIFKNNTNKDEYTDDFKNTCAIIIKHVEAACDKTDVLEKKSQKEKEIQEIICPITHATISEISDPVQIIHEDGTISQHIFEYEALEQWKQTQGVLTNPTNRKKGTTIKHISHSALVMEFMKEVFNECVKKYYNQLNDQEAQTIKNAMKKILHAIIKIQYHTELDNELLSSTNAESFDDVKKAIEMGANINTQNDYDGKIMEILLFSLLLSVVIKRF